MEDFTKPAVDCFVDAMYTGEVEKLEKGIFEEVNKMAHVFDVSWLGKRCLKYFKTDVLKFENISYDDIMFACEIASRAQHNLKQSKFVSCFVKNVTFGEIGKSTFIQRYMAGFAELPKRLIDMSIAIAGNDLNIIGNCLTCYLSLTLRCKGFDENSLYMLQKVDVQKFSRTFPSEFNELANFLAEISTDSECAEVKAVVERFVKVRSIGASSSAKEELEEDEIAEDLEDSDDEYLCKDVAFQTDEIKSGNYIIP